MQWNEFAIVKSLIAACSSTLRLRCVDGVVGTLKLSSLAYILQHIERARVLPIFSRYTNYHFTSLHFQPLEAAPSAAISRKWAESAILSDLLYLVLLVDSTVTSLSTTTKYTWHSCEISIKVQLKIIDKLKTETKNVWKLKRNKTTT